MILRGEEVILGVGIEDPEARGIEVQPQAWIPARAASSIKQVVKKALIKETRGSKMESTGSDIVEKHAEGELEMNVRSQSIGFFLLSLFGKVQTTPVSGTPGAFSHFFLVLPSNPEHPSLTGVLHQPGIQDYQYPLLLCSGLALEVTPEDNVTAKATMIAKDEEDAGVDAFTPVFLTDDVDPYFRHFDAKLSFADDVATASAEEAEAVCVREMSLEITNGARIDQCISEVTPGNVVMKQMTVKGKFKIDVDGTEKYDWLKENTKKACVIKFERPDVTISPTTHNPILRFQLPFITIENVSFDRPLDDVATATFDFVAHYDVEQGYGVTAFLKNGRSAYAFDEGSGT